MRDRANEFGGLVWFAILSLIFFGILAFGIVAMNSQLMPWQKRIERTTVENSKSFIDSTNSNLMNLKSEYMRLSTKIAESSDKNSIAAYRAQQSAVLQQMCVIVSSMQRDTVRAEVRSFISENGGC